MTFLNETFLRIFPNLNWSMKSLRLFRFIICIGTVRQYVYNFNEYFSAIQKVQYPCRLKINENRLLKTPSEIISIVNIMTF